MEETPKSGKRAWKLVQFIDISYAHLMSLRPLVSGGRLQSSRLEH